MYNHEDGEGPLLPLRALGAVAILCAAVLVALAALGPLGTEMIQYRSSQSGIWQIEGNDLANLVLMVPLLLAGGILALMGRDGAKYLLILTPVTLMYYGLSVGIGQEWSDPAIAGNVEDFFLLHLALIVGGLLLLVGSMSMFSPRDAPAFKPRGLRLFVGLTALFLVLFTFMWFSQVMEVQSVGDLADGSYSAAPTSFWAIRFLDLGISVPVGFLSLYLLMVQPKRAYHLVLLFFGFFVTTATAVNSMALLQLVHGDPAAQALGPGLAVFAVLGVLAYALLYFVVKDKVQGWRAAA